MESLTLSASRSGLGLEVHRYKSQVIGDSDLHVPLTTLTFVHLPNHSLLLYTAPTMSWQLLALDARSIRSLYDVGV